MADLLPPAWLPREVRRALFFRRHPRVKQRWDRMMTGAQGSYSFAPFHRLRCIFVHIPKAAGTSVCRSLFGNLAGGHTSIAEYQLIFTRKQFADYFKFTVVRNPWDRLFSAYRFLASGGMNDADRRFSATHLAQFRDFETFVLSGIERPEIQRYFHFRPQHTFLSAPGGAAPLLDFVGLYENLAEDFEYLSARLFGEHARPLQHVNRTAAGDEIDYRDAYTPDMREVVARVYEEDIRALGYSFANESLAAQIALRGGGSAGNA